MKKFIWLIPLLVSLCFCAGCKVDASSTTSDMGILDQYMYVNLPQLKKDNQRILH